MRQISIFIALLLLVIPYANAQINLNKVLKNSQKKAEKNIENRISNKIDKGVDNTLDDIEEGVGGVVKGDDSKTKTAQTESKTSTDEKIATGSKTGTNTSNPKTQPPAPQDAVGPSPTLQWAKYDFVPGTEIIFEDDFREEKNGEFPSRWDITKGTVEIAQFGEDMVVYFRKTNANVPEAIMPYLKNRSSDYLPDEFTIEFDCYFYDKKADNKTYYLFLYDSKNQMKIMSPSKPIRVDFNRVTYDHVGDYYPGQNEFKPIAGWRHVAISFNKRALKGYLDDTRLMNIPNIEFNPTGVMLSAGNVSGSGSNPFIKNVRIAKGAVPLYDKFLVDGKFITTGIKFDVNKATIKPESMGTINYVVKMMTDHPELKFSVEGHTDSDGDEAANQKLSEARSKTVMDQMVKLGIEKTRLTNKGYGEKRPMTGNETPEEKAQNRRVEFVKF
jgi:outer membrane protein OmpA-like peptidoglycan-associated protein